nr:RNA-directed DNA polymerase, eukaryota, reverse transcriptase zinc-binding domain protein [Tanacetum cinerariifolium]
MAAGSSNIDIAMREFKACVNKIEVLDIQQAGLKFTWNQKPKGVDGILKKLDRVLSNIEFNDMFQGSHAIFQPYHLSDHASAVLKLPLIVRAKPKPFKFTNLLRALDLDPFNLTLREEEAAYVQAFKEAILLEEKFLKQKAKIDWLREGHRNSSYFHKLHNDIVNASDDEDVDEEMIMEDIRGKKIANTEGESTPKDKVINV